jgi:hypothetical protein
MTHIAASAAPSRSRAMAYWVTTALVAAELAVAASWVLRPSHRRDFAPSGAAR